MQSWFRGALFAVATVAALGVSACGDDDAQPGETHCDDGLDNDGDSSIDCEDLDCQGLPHCRPVECGDGVAEGDEACDGADLGVVTCVSLGFDEGTLSCNSTCKVDFSGCSYGPFCGDDVYDVGEECDGLDLAGATCETLGLEPGALYCDPTYCEYDTRYCGAILETCATTGPRSTGVTGTLTCAEETGLDQQWDGYGVMVTAGDCVDIVADNGTGSADLLAYAIDADGIAVYGRAGDYSQLDDEMACTVSPWNDYDCPAASVVAKTTGELQILVAQYSEEGTTPGVDTCSNGLSAYTLFVAVNGVEVTPTLLFDDQPL